MKEFPTTGPTMGMDSRGLGFQLQEQYRCRALGPEIAFRSGIIALMALLVREKRISLIFSSSVTIMPGN
jgi:hypothetical protein